MAATSTRSQHATKKAANAAGGTAAGLTPIWIRLPRMGDAQLRDDESLDGEATARSFSESRPDPASASARTEARPERGVAGSRKASVAPPEDLEEDDLLEEAPAYLREVADRRRSATTAAETDDDDFALSDSPRTKRSGTKAEVRPSANFFTHVFKAPYNVLAGVALVGVFVALYACFKPGTEPTEVPVLDPGPSLTLDLGEPSSPSEAYVGGPTAVDPSTLYPETYAPAQTELGSAAEFQPVPGIASANYAATPPTSASTDPTASTALDASFPGTAAINASAKVSVDSDPSLAGLPVETYPDTDPANYRYPADANFDVPSGVERTAEGASVAPRAASLGDTLEKTPVR